MCIIALIPDSRYTTFNSFPMRNNTESIFKALRLAVGSQWPLSAGRIQTMNESNNKVIPNAVFVKLNFTVHPPLVHVVYF